MASGPTLGDLIDTVGVLDLLVAPSGIDKPIADTVIYDSEEGLAGGAGDVVLAVGVDVTNARAANDIVEKAAAAGASALVVKTRGDRADLEPLIDAAAAAGVAVLAAAPDMAWGYLHSLVRTATAAGGAEETGGAPIGDLFAHANAVAAQMGGPVTIEDPRSTVLAYSNLADHEVDEGRRATILGHRVPDEWIERQTKDGVFRQLYREHGVVHHHYAEFGLKPRMATAVRAGDEVIGTIWVQQGTKPFDAEAEAALMEAARIAALHLLRHRSGADLERGRRAELLRAALEGRAAPDALASVLQLPTATPLTVVAFGLTGPVLDDSAAAAVLADRVAGLVALYCESYRRRAAVVAIGPTVYVLLPHDDGSERDRLPAFVSGVADKIDEALKTKVRAALGGTVGSLADLLDSRAEADLVLRAMGSSAERVASADSVRAQFVLEQLRTVAAREPGLRAGKIDVLLEHDQKRGTEYVATLRAFFDALGDMPAAAAAQGVHPNTFRYRMRRLAETAGLDLDDPVERLVLQLQLQFLGGTN
jgi:hypothetical protein